MATSNEDEVMREDDPRHNERDDHREYDDDPREYRPRRNGPPPNGGYYQRRSNTPRSRVNADNPLNIGAFAVIPQLQVYIDPDMAGAIADHILHYGSENSALISFAHQLRNNIGD